MNEARNEASNPLMLDHVATHGSRGLGEEAAVVTALSAFLQAGLVHLGEGPLAMRSAEDLASRVGRWAAARGRIEIRVVDDQAVVDGTAVSSAGDAEYWLVLAMSRCGIGSLTLSADVRPDSLLAFASALRAATEPGGPSLMDAWNGEGILLAPPAPTESPAEIAARMLQSLARSENARSVLGQLHAAIDLEYAGAERLDSVRMLGAIVEHLPEAVRSDDRAACEAIESVLDGILSELDGFLTAHPENPAERIARIASDLAEARFHAPPQSHHIESIPGQLPAFAMPEADPFSDPSMVRLAEPEGEVPPGDSDGAAQEVAFLESASSGQSVVPVDAFAAFDPRRVADDPQALVAELAKLTPPRDLRLDPFAPQLTDELLGASLHLLVHAGDAERVEGLVTPLIDRALADPSPSQRRTLGRYLRLARERGGGEGDERTVRLIDFLSRHGVDQLMTTRETIDVEQVIQTFPAQLLVWVDALTLRDKDSHQQFVRLCDAVGDEALAEVCRLLIDDGTLLAPNRTEKILKFGGARVAAIARMLVETEASWTRPQVVNFLRRQELPRAEAAALAIIQPVTQLPTPYLADLCRAVQRGRADSKIHGYTSLLLRHYVRDSANRPEELDRRLYAIRALAHWPSPENVQYLEDLSRTGRLISQSKEARAVRQTAAETLKLVRSSERGR